MADLSPAPSLHCGQSAPCVRYSPHLAAPAERPSSAHHQHPPGIHPLLLVLDRICVGCSECSLTIKGLRQQYPELTRTDARKIMKLKRIYCSACPQGRDRPAAEVPHLTDDAAMQLATSLAGRLRLTPAVVGAAFPPSVPMQSLLPPLSSSSSGFPPPLSVPSSTVRPLTQNQQDDDETGSCESEEHFPSRWLPPGLT